MSDYEQPKFYRRENPKCRKVTKCCECRGEIKVGEQYHKVSGVWGAEFDTYRTCNDCEQLRDEINKDRGSQEGTYFGGLFEDCSETGDEWLDKLVTIKVNRGAKIPDWVYERLLEAKESKS